MPPALPPQLENILLKEPGNLDTVTIADFGFAKRLLETQNGGALGAEPAPIALRRPLPCRRTGLTLARPPRSDVPPGAAFHTLLGTPSYNAPEVLEQAALYKEPLADGSPLRGAYDSALDIWAVGVMLFKMLSGRLPFEAGSEYELYQKIRAGRINMARARASGLPMLLSSPRPQSDAAALRPSGRDRVGVRGRGRSEPRQADADDRAGEAPDRRDCSHSGRASGALRWVALVG